MAAKPLNRKFMGRAGGVVHVVTTKANDLKNSNCASLKAGHNDGVWKGKGLSPEAALALKGCSRCDTERIAKEEKRARMTPAQKRAESKARAQETRDSMSRVRKGPKDKAVKAHAAKRRGPKGGDPTAKMKANVEEHLALAQKAGWKGKAWESDTNEWRVEVEKSGETLRLVYRDGRTVHSRVTLKSGVEVRLRNSSNWRKHVAGESGVKADYQPRQKGSGKRNARNQTIDESSARWSLPFDAVLDDDDTVIESLVGKRITWRNSTSGTLDSALVPSRSRNVRVYVHPKTDRRILSFYESQGFAKDRDGDVHESLGGERSVYLDKVLKVR